MRSPVLSIIIVNYNVKYFLEQALLSVRKACKDLDAEIFVVDNNSVDGSAGMVKEKFPEVNLIVNDINQGFSKANNQAIELAKGRYILLLNPDTVVEEDTFLKVTAFMDQHPEAGGLGVKMIDGAGNFLPESKRGLPSPKVAFFKVFGLSALFPRSRTFGRYHLSYLDKDQVHEVEILSGAFMLLRKEALDKTGLLDESFFMYGEDIDLSYRLILAGYKNYYFPHTSIIHYKGESTKKSSINYVFVFYNAMIIFARKHFSKNNAKLFSTLINFAIYLRAGIAILIRFFKKMSLTLLDFSVIYIGINFIKDFWEENIRNASSAYYPVEYMKVIIPGYIAIWLMSVYFSGGYEKPVRAWKIARGIIAGTVLILVIYALLPEEYRYSRALILLGSAWTILAMNGVRILMEFIGIKAFRFHNDKRKRLLVVGEVEEGNRVLSLLNFLNASFHFLGFVSPRSLKEEDHSYLGSISHLSEIVEVYHADEVIFCAKNVSAHQIIEKMSMLSRGSVEYKIAPPESLYIIGSNSIHSNGELYVIDINSINKPANKRNKRIIDIGVSLFFLLFFPFTVLKIRMPGRFFINILKVMAGNRTWVGYYESSATPGNFSSLPRIKKGIISPVIATRKTDLDHRTIERLNALYAKDYKIDNDLYIIWKGFSELGNVS
jgi:O-antigen biosynthesis protein